MITARPRDTLFLVPEKNRAAQNRASWGLYLCSKWDFFPKNRVSSRLLFKIRVLWGYTYVLKGIFIAYFLAYLAIGTFEQLGPLGNWEIRTSGQLGQNSKNQMITVIKDVRSDINESAIRICIGCKNDLQ